MNVGPLSMHKCEEGDNEAPAWPKSLSLVSQSESGLFDQCRFTCGRVTLEFRFSQPKN